MSSLPQSSLLVLACWSLRAAALRVDQAASMWQPSGVMVPPRQRPLYDPLELDFVARAPLEEKVPKSMASDIFRLTVHPDIGSIGRLFLGAWRASATWRDMMGATSRDTFMRSLNFRFVFQDDGRGVLRLDVFTNIDWYGLGMHRMRDSVDQFEIYYGPNGPGVQGSGLCYLSRLLADNEAWLNCGYLFSIQGDRMVAQMDFAEDGHFVKKTFELRRER